ncbi:MAG TPA: hypothetical protein VF498_02385 [Anaerolineales bacterium]
MNNIKDLASNVNDNRKMKVLIIGAAAGAAVGLAAAYLLNQTAEREGREPQMSPGDGVRLGLLVLGLLRSITVLGEKG